MHHQRYLFTNVKLVLLNKDYNSLENKALFLSTITKAKIQPIHATLKKNVFKTGDTVKLNWSIKGSLGDIIKPENVTVNSLLRDDGSTVSLSEVVPGHYTVQASVAIAGKKQPIAVTTSFLVTDERSISDIKTLLSSSHGVKVEDMDSLVGEPFGGSTAKAASEHVLHVSLL